MRGRCTTLQTLPDNAIELEAKQLVDKVLARIKNTGEWGCLVLWRQLRQAFANALRI